MKIAVIAAMQKELDLLLPLLESPSHRTTPHARPYTVGIVGTNEVALMQSGIGKVNAALAANDLIEAFAPALVINSGVAGGVGAAGVLDAVAGSRVAYHDVWCGSGTEPGQAADCPLFFTPPKHVLEARALDGVVKGLICSGDIFVSRPEEVEHIRSIYPDAQAVDMESAAIAQTAYLAGVDFLALRVVSDTPGADDNISQYQDFWTAAPESTFRLLKNLLEELG